MGDKIIQTPVKKAWPISKTHNAHVSVADSKGKVSVVQQLRQVLHASIVISEKRNNDGPVRVRKRYDCWNEVRWLLGDGNSHLYLGRARSTVSAVMTAYKKCGNVTSGKHNSGRKRKLTDRDKRVLTRIVARKREQSLSQITSEGNSYLRNPISARTVQRELHASNLYGRVGIRKPLVTARQALQLCQWCRTHRQWAPQQWQQVIWSDESTFTLFQTTGRVYVWRTPKEAFAPESSCRLLSMVVGPLWYGGRYLGVVLGHLLLGMARLKLPTMSISWGIRCIHLSRLHFAENAHFIKTTTLLSTLLKSCKNGLQSMRGK
ncbi:transposable element Tcb1 transposase [Trichonephila clavipes]|nr:transposable element Tcb1 transposase [Trichonephila clavipes]